MKKLLILTIIFNLFGLYVQSQELSKKEIKETVYKIADIIEKNYVLEEKGNTIGKDFITKFKNGAFDSATDWKQLEKLITGSLREISNDGHLYVRNDLELVKELKQETSNEKKDIPEEQTNFFNNEKALRTNFGFKQVAILDNNIGYIQLTSINLSDISLRTLYAAMTFIKHTNALIIDLRNNGGGGGTVGAVFDSYFFEKETELLEFKTRDGETSISKTVPWLLEEKYTKPLYILINQKTGSAAEAFAFALQQKERATIVGQSSAGAANMNTYFLINDNLILSVSSAAPFIPGTQISWERMGIQPNVIVDEQEALEKAVNLIKYK